MRKITPLPSSMAVFVGGPKDGWKVADPKVQTFYVPKPPDHDPLGDPVPDMTPRLVRGVYERRWNKDTGVPGYVWVGWR